MNRSFFALDSVVVRRMALAVVLAASGLGVAGCASDAQTGALVGAGLGALAGQAIGGDTQGTLIGAAVGGGAGYLLGNEQDKKHRARGDGRPMPIPASHRCPCPLDS